MKIFFKSGFWWMLKSAMWRHFQFVTQVNFEQRASAIKQDNDYCLSTQQRFICSDISWTGDIRVKKNTQLDEKELGQGIVKKCEYLVNSQNMHLQRGKSWHFHRKIIFGTYITFGIWCERHPKLYIYCSWNLTNQEKDLSATADSCIKDQTCTISRKRGSVPMPAKEFVL